MKVNLGDIILIPLSNGWKAVAKIVFIPVGDFKKVISFIVLDFSQDEQITLERLRDKPALPLVAYVDVRYQIFTAKDYIRNKEWPILFNIPLTEDETQYQIYQVAGDLYHNETQIGKISPGEYRNYTALRCAGFGSVDQLLVLTVESMLEKNQLQIKKI